MDQIPIELMAHQNTEEGKDAEVIQEDDSVIKASIGPLHKTLLYHGRMATPHFPWDASLNSAIFLE